MNGTRSDGVSERAIMLLIVMLFLGNALNYVDRQVLALLKPTLGYKLCAEIAREGYETGKSLHAIVVGERRLMTKAQWDEVFSFDNLIRPKSG